MGYWRKAVCVCFWALLFALCGITAQAAGFSPSLSCEEGEPGGVVEVSVIYDGSLGEVAAFRASVEYDPAVLEYLRPAYGESVREGTVTTVSAFGKVESVFTADQGTVLAAGEGITYRFRVVEGATPGKSSLFVSVFEISGPEPSPLGNDTDVSFGFLVPEPPSSDARLVYLAPDVGELEPGFSPECLEYTMTVPYEVDAITFLAEPVAGAVCRVNRKNLGSGGSDTLFKITVTAQDGETKAVYQVTVHLDEKVKTAATEKPASTTGAGGTPAPSPTAEAAPEDPTGQKGSPQPDQEALVMAATGDSGNTGGGGDGASPSGVSGVTFQNGNASLVPGMLALLAFVLFCFLSGPIAKSLASRFPGKQQSEESPSEKP